MTVSSTRPDDIDKIATIIKASANAGIRVVINARTDVYLKGIGAPEARLGVAIDRGKAFLEQRVVVAARTSGKIKALAQAGTVAVLCPGANFTTHGPRPPLEAMRRAEDGDAFAREVEALLGVAPRVLSGEEEATYSFLGATRVARASPRSYDLTSKP